MKISIKDIQLIRAMKKDTKNMELINFIVKLDFTEQDIICKNEFIINSFINLLREKSLLQL